jgi:hypothetical protein
MAQHLDLHRHDVELLADLFANLHHRRAAGADPLVFWQLVNDVDAWQFCRQWCALAARFDLR